MRISTVIIDYGMGNLRSVQKAFEACGEKAIVSSSPKVILEADRLVLPGVGAFGQAMTRLRKLGLIQPIRQKIKEGTPYLGICLGLQILFESSEESPRQKGLGVFPGTVKRFKGDMKIPHIGWNQVRQTGRCPLFKGIKKNSYFYFVHSYYVGMTKPSLTAGTTLYGKLFCSALWKDRIFATQFHPEKSQGEGLKVIKNFMAATR